VTRGGRSQRAAWHLLVGRVTPCAPWFVNPNRRAEDWPPLVAVQELRFVQRDAGAHPGLVDIEIYAHHFALTHAD
jgi:hypothetical protein